MTAIIIVFIAIALLVTIANRINVAYPIVLVLGGMAIGYIPGVPTIQLPPEFVLVVFLPPLLYWESLWAPTSEFRAGALWIFQMAFGLVIATTAAVAVIAHAIVPGMGWGVAFVLGAIVSSTDEVAFFAIVDRLNVPRHVAASIEGESLVNDATSLILYGVGIAAVVGASFSLLHAAGSLVFSVVVSVGLGLAVAGLAVLAWRILRDDTLQATVSVVVPFLAYLPAYYLGDSGVLATVTAGMRSQSLHAHRARADGARTAHRLLGDGRLLPQRLHLRRGGNPVSSDHLGSAPVLIDSADLVGGCRVGYVHGGASGLDVCARPDAGDQRAGACRREGRLVARRRACLDRDARRRVARGGPRDSLGDHVRSVSISRLVDFPDFLRFACHTRRPRCDLAFLIKKLGVKDDGASQREEQLALAATARSAIERLDELERSGAVPREIADLHRTELRSRLEEFTSPGDRRRAAHTTALFRQTRRLLIEAQRAKLNELRKQGKIDNTVQRRLTRVFDLQTIEVKLLENTAAVRTWRTSDASRWRAGDQLAMFGGDKAA